MNLNYLIGSPLEQFQIINLLPFYIHLPLGIDLSLTNSALVEILSVIIFVILLKLTVDTGLLVPAHWQSVIEMYYETILGLVQDNIGKKGYKYFPFVFTLFTFILILNLLGMIPYVISVTAHISIAIGLSLSIWFGVTILGFHLHGTQFLSMFMPQGAPLALAPLLVIIELVSYSARAISLGLRLAANISAGHMLLGIIGGFGWTMLCTGGLAAVGSIIPIGLIFILTFLELSVAVIQAYVFSLLTIIYINDAVNLH